MGRTRPVRYRGRTEPVVDEMTLGGKRYLILEKLKGGDRQRYRAFDPLAGPKGDMRAICVLPRSQATGQHVEVLQRLSQNNRDMPAILEYHRRGGQIFLVMPWVWGLDLKTHLRLAGRGRFRWPSAVQAFNLFRRFAHLLRSFHRGCNLVHGDVTPANLVLCRNPNRLVMIDFGSAWAVEKTLARDIGDGKTDPYASPEQHEGREFIDFRSDQFSASVIGYQLLTGDVPYDKMGGKAGHPEFRDEFAETYVPPSQCCRDRRPLPPKVWTKIDRVITKGLSFDSKARYETDELWLDDLDDIDTDLNRRPRENLISRLVRTAAGYYLSFSRRK